MNEQTEQLIRELADKLGTTTEHLWGVLVKQAPLSATVEIMYALAACALLATCVKMVSWAGKRIIEGEDEERDVMAMVWGITIGIFSIILVATAVANAATTLSGFLNPEYWALKQLLN